MGFGDIFGDEREDRALEKIARALTFIAHDFHRTFLALDFKLFQIEGDSFMPILGVQVGSSGVFQASLIPANAVPLQSGPTFASDDLNVTLTQDSVDPFKVTAAVAAGDTAASFNLTVSGVNGAGTAISHTFAIPLTQAPPPQAVDFDLNQLS